jgi:2-(1,2-epoxy-1,2-dihydrophenyl)acetyl-CoA isomerase
LSSPQLLSAKNGGVLSLTMNRPEKLNALTAEMLDSLTGSFADASSDVNVRAVLLSGSGRAFCVGQDLGERNVAPGADLGSWLERHYNPLIRAIRRLGKPVVACVNGIAAGAGANLAFACDIVIAAASAQFIESFARIGLIPDSGGTWMLPRLIGHARAIGVSMTAAPMTARQAHEWGAIWKVVDDSALQAECDALVCALASAPTKALAAIKKSMDAAWSGNLEAHLELERDLQRALGETRDFREGIEAFAQKREPHFKGE